MYMRHWLQSPSSLTHGNIIKREIFSKRTEDSTDEEGAILRYVDSFSRCYLEPKIASVPTAFDDRQLIFFIVDGAGVFEAGDLKQQVGEGDAILVPPGLTHVLENPNGAPLEFLILEEVLPDGTEAPRTNALIRNYRERPLGQGHWTHLVQSDFRSRRRLGNRCIQYSSCGLKRCKHLIHTVTVPIWTKSGICLKATAFML